MDTKMAALFAVVLLAVVSHVAGHGRLLEPPSRASAWRFGFKTPPNYQDNELFCGGFDNQWARNGGKCGVCGDPYQGVREHEAGGKYATGTIVRKYQAGDVIKTTIDITANHKGWFEFRICDVNDPKVKATFECLDRHLLRFAGTKETRFPVSSDMKMVEIDLQLPKDLTCSQCVFQWKYHAGNNWGTDKKTGQSGLGLGPQEEFYGCSDVTITGKRAPNQSTLTPSQIRTKEASTAQPTRMPSTPKPKPSTKASISTIIPTAKTTSKPGKTTSKPEKTTKVVRPPGRKGCGYRCCSTGIWMSVKGMDKWCNDNCKAGYCPPSHCFCIKL